MLKSAIASNPNLLFTRTYIIIYLLNVLRTCFPGTDLVTGDKAGVTDALQLCALLLPQTNRTCLHRMLRFLYKASSNSQLVLCQGKGNKEVLLKHFASAVLRSCSKLSRVGLAERQRVEQLVAFMAQNYQHIFKVCTMYMHDGIVHCMCMHPALNEASLNGQNFKATIHQATFRQ